MTLFDRVRKDAFNRGRLTQLTGEDKDDFDLHRYDFQKEVKTLMTRGLNEMSGVATAVTIMVQTMA